MITSGHSAHQGSVGRVFGRKNVRDNTRGGVPNEELEDDTGAAFISDNGHLIGQTLNHIKEQRSDLLLQNLQFSIKAAVFLRVSDSAVTLLLK